LWPSARFAPGRPGFPTPQVSFSPTSSPWRVPSSTAASIAPPAPEGKARRWRKLAVWSERYGIYGYADLVEEVPGGVIPVEYKRGKAVPSWSDRIHLALIALCLEEMLRLPVDLGYLYYFGSRRRVEIPISLGLKRAAVSQIQATRELLAQGKNRPQPSPLPSAGVVPFPQRVWPPFPRASPGRSGSDEHGLRPRGTGRLFAKTGIRSWW